MAKKKAAAEAEFKTRRAEPGMAFGYTTPEGKQVTFRAGDDGLVTAKNVDQENILLAMDLPVARDATPAKTTPAAPATPEPTVPVAETAVSDTKEG